MSLVRSIAYVESIDGFEKGLGGILVRLQGVCDIANGDRVETSNETMFRVESCEHVDDLFDSFTLVSVTLMLPSGPLPVRLEKTLVGKVTIHLGIERAAERLLWFGSPSTDLTKKYLWKGGTS